MATNHTIDFKKTNSLAQIDKLESRIIREAIEIEKRDHAMNVRDDSKRLPMVWHTVISDRKITPTPISHPTLIQAQQPIPPSTITQLDINANLNIPTPSTSSSSQSILPSHTPTNSTEPSFINRIITRSMSQILQNFIKN